MKLKNAMEYVSYFITKNEIEDEDIKQNLYLYILEYYNDLKTNDASRTLIYENVKRRYKAELSAKKCNSDLLIPIDSIGITYTIDFDIIDLKLKISELLNTITEKESDILILRYGLLDGIPLTYREIGEEYYGVHYNSCNHTLVRHMILKALRRVRHPNRSKKIRDYYDN